MLHSSYSFALGFEADLVKNLLPRLDIDQDSVVLDPFCGTGTTLLESKINGYPSIGVDANPVCVMISKAKTSWNVNIEEASAAVARISRLAARRYASCARRSEHARLRGSRYSVQSDPLFMGSDTGRYLIESGLIHRGWIGPRPALKALLLAQEIRKLTGPIREFLFLSFLGLLVPEFSNMAYGPEIYRRRRRRDRDVFGLFQNRAADNLQRLLILKDAPRKPRSRVRLGDSANGGLRFVNTGSVGAIISSPPYLSDHDYSRLMRLELVFTGMVSSQADLRGVKQLLLRSSSKNVYKDDCCTRHVIKFKAVRDAIETVRDRAAGKSSGFARVYPRLVGEYFGGMYQHFRTVGRVLRPGGYAAYIVGDQSSFFATPIPTARILAHLAESCKAGLEITSMEPFRTLRGTRGAVTWANSEWLMLLRKKPSL